MSSHGLTEARTIHERLKHPIIDADGHWAEFAPHMRDQFRPYGDRIIPAAIIPMYTPEEALEELEFASRQLGFKVVMMGSLIRRPIPALVEEHPEAAKFVEWYDPVAIDSEHDYDPVWA